MKNMEALSMEELEMVSGGKNVDMANMGEAAKAPFNESLMQSFVWIKKPPNS